MSAGIEDGVFFLFEADGAVQAVCDVVLLKLIELSLVNRVFRHLDFGLLNLRAFWLN